MSELRPTVEDSHQDRQKGIGSRILGSLRGDRLLTADAQDKVVLPESIRFAMAHRGARLSGKDVETLQRSGMPRPAFYLAMKAANGQTAVQAEMLRRLAGLQFDYDRLGIEDIRLGTAMLDGRSGRETTTVGGEKLGQFSRHGFTGDVAAFDSTLKAALDGKPEAPLFMVANYPYIAVDTLAQHSLNVGNPLGIINPDLIGQTGTSPGFIMQGEAPDITITPLGQDFEIPSGAVIFDDVLREGKTRDVVMAWAGRSAMSPEFVTATTQPAEKHFF